MPNLQTRAEYILTRLESAGECKIYPSLRRAYLTVDGRPELVYRILWQHFKGPVPPGLNVLHKCDNPTCCNLDHLELGTQRKNVLDAVLRERVETASPLPGVSWQASRGRWLVMPRVNGQKRTLYAGPSLFEAACRLRSFQQSLKALE